MSTKSTAGTSTVSIDLAQLRASMQALKVVMASEPLRRFMEGRDASPDDGWLLLLPDAMKDAAGAFPPRYVQFSPFVTEPLLVRDFLGLASK